MPADNQRFAMEAQASKAETDHLWDEAGHQVAAPILDSGAIQFKDGHIALVKISRTMTTLEPEIGYRFPVNTLIFVRVLAKWCRH